MKKRPFRALAALLLAAVILLPCLLIPSSAEESDAKIQSYNEQMEDLKQKQEDAQAKINQTKNDISNAVEYKKAIDESLEVTYTKISLAQDMLSELDVKIADKEADIVRQEEIIEDRREKFKKRMVSIADDGSFSHLALILSAGSVSDFLTIYDSVSSILAYDRKVMGELREAREALVASKDELEAARAAQTNTLEELHNSESYFSSLSAENQNLINNLSNNEAELEKNYQFYVDEEAKIAAELQAYMKQLQEQQKTTFSGGAYVWPLEGYTTISSGFGYRNIQIPPIEGFHRGIDIPAPSGYPIRACNGGTVVRSEFHYSWGNYVLIDHGGGYSTLYAHMTTRYVSAGQTVSAGETIGAVGETGHAYGAHLHLEYWINGEITDPTALFWN